MTNKTAKRNKARRNKAKREKAEGEGDAATSCGVTSTPIEPTAQSSTDDCFEIRDIPGKGKGMVALVDIPKGTRIIKEAPLMVAPSGGLAAVLVECNFSKLSRDRQKLVLQLRNSFPEAPLALMSIFKTNAIELGGDHAAVYATICRINHSCLPNANHFWNEALGMETVHALRDIQQGEEITISYCLHEPRDVRHTKLKDRYAFECQCEACTYTGEMLTESDDRRRRVVQLEAAIDNLGRGISTPRTVIGDCEKLVTILETEYGKGTPFTSRTYYDAFQVASLIGDFSAAKRYARLAYDGYVLLVGEDNPTPQRIKAYIQNPRTYSRFGQLRR